MLQRYRHFALTSVIAIGLAVGILALSYRSLTINALEETQLQKNEVLTSALSGTNWPLIKTLLNPPAGLSRDELRMRSEVALLRDTLEVQLRGRVLVKIKIYSKKGITVFSTQSNQIGEDKRDNPGFIAAVKGEKHSNIVHRNSFNAYDEVIEKTDLIQCYVPLRDAADGRIQGVYELYTDITPFLRRIKEIEWNLFYGILTFGILYGLLVFVFRHIDKESRFNQDFLDSIGDALFLHALDGRFVDVNRRACASLGYTRQELLRLSVSDVEMELKPGATRENRGLKAGEAQAVTGVHRRKNGTTFPVDVRMTLVSLNGNKRVIALARDITASLQTEKELQHAKEVAETANQEKSNYIARLSHGVRTPLNAVIGMTDLLLTTQLTQKQRNYIESIRTGGELVIILINDTLDFARLEAGTLQIEETTFVLGAVVEDVVNMMGYRAYAKGLELACFFETDVTMPIAGDPDRLREILLNLISNAVKFTHQGTVTVSVSRVAETSDAVVFRFSVRDTGIGISPRGRTTLFKPFTQLHTGNNSDDQGSGLGLAISKRVVEAMGGGIEVESQPGEGSVFWFEVPLRKSVGAGELGLDSGLENRLVLVVAGHSTIRRMLCHHLQGWYMWCDAVTHTGEALKLLRQAASGADPYQFVVMDMDAQEEEVISLARQIKSEPALASLCTILLTPVTRPVGVGVISSLGDVHCLNKPVLPSRLRAALLGIADRGIAGDPVFSASSLPPHTGSGERQKASILVAEDNPVSRWMLMDMLGTLGYAASAVADGSAVLKAAAEKSYDALLLDCQMPGMDGDQVAAELQGRDPDRRPLIIAVTADVSTENLNRCKAAGMDDILTKPLRLETLQNKLQQWLLAGNGGQVPSPAPGATTEDDGSPIDRGVWTTLQGNDERQPGFLSELVRLFSNDADARLQEIASHIADGRPDQAVRAVHALRAGCLQIGASGMAELCKELHQAAKAGPSEKVVALSARLRDESERVRQFLESELQRPSSDLIP